MKKTVKNIFIGAVIIIAIITLARFAWSKYMTSINGEAKADIAHFYFKVNDKSMQHTGKVAFASTRDDSNKEVDKDMLAPGTYGHIPIKIEATGSETYIEYKINIDLENKPTNLKFYYDSNRKKEIYIKDNKITREGFISWDDENKIRYENIYWEWPLETGNTLREIETNDVEDSRFMNTLMVMNITVIGAQVQEKPIYLADVVNVGDYVNYDANSNGIYTHAMKDDLPGGEVDEKFTTEESVRWRVLNIDKENNLVTLMAADPIAKSGDNTQSKKVTLHGLDAYKNIGEELNKIGSIYGNGKGAILGRSINIDDVMDYSCFDPTDSTQYSNSNSSNGAVGGVKIYTSGNFPKGEVYKGMEVVTGGVYNQDETVTASIDNLVTVIQTSYNTKDSDTTLASFENKDIQNGGDGKTGKEIYEILFKNSTNIKFYKATYWLSSRCISLSRNNAYCYGMYVYNGYVYDGNLYCSDGNTYAHSYGVLPVVTLKANIKTTGTDSSNVWQLDV